MYLIVFLLFLMFRPPTRSTRTYTLFPYTTLFRSPFLILSCSSGENSMLRLPFVKSQPLKKLPFCSCPVIVRRGFEATPRSEEHTSELQSLMRISYAVFCLKKKNAQNSQKAKQSTMYDRARKP